MNRYARLLVMLDNSATFALLASAVDDYRATLFEHLETFADGPEAEYFARCLCELDELRRALWE